MNSWIQTPTVSELKDLGSSLLSLFEKNIWIMLYLPFIYVYKLPNPLHWLFKSVELIN